MLNILVEILKKSEIPINSNRNRYKTTVNHPRSHRDYIRRTGLTTDTFYLVRFSKLLNIFDESLEIFENSENIFLELQRTYRKHTTGLEYQQGEYATVQIPSGRVTRAETWLTVYRSLYIMMLLQLVADFRGERLSVNFDAKFLMM